MILSVISIIEGYNNADSWVNDLNSYCFNNLKYVDSFLKSNNIPITFKIPTATYFAWLDCNNLHLSNLEIQQKLINSGVAIMSGENYKESIPHLRLNIACPIVKIENGLNKLKDVFSN